MLWLDLRSRRVCGAGRRKSVANDPTVSGEVTKKRGTDPWWVRYRNKAMSMTRVRSRGLGSIGLNAREIVGGLRAVTLESLSRDELQYRVGESSWLLWMDLGEEDGEAMETTESETFFSHEESGLKEETLRTGGYKYNSKVR